MNINEFAKEVHTNACEKGWWDEPRTFGEIVALCHSELSEALEEFRAGRDMVWYANKDEKTKPEGIAVEMADCIIRILDWVGKENIDMDAIIREKMDYNKTRPYRHGGKVL